VRTGLQVKGIGDCLYWDLDLAPCGILIQSKWGATDDEFFSDEESRTRGVSEYHHGDRAWGATGAPLKLGDLVSGDDLVPEYVFRLGSGGCWSGANYETVGLLGIRQLQSVWCMCGQGMQSKPDLGFL
jgi:hypothetical protein